LPKSGVVQRDGGGLKPSGDPGVAGCFRNGTGTDSAEPRPWCLAALGVSDALAGAAATSVRPDVNPSGDVLGRQFSTLPRWRLRLAHSRFVAGVRQSLRWSDLDLDAGRLRVVQTIIQVRSKVMIGEPKTARGRRPIALYAGTVAVLREHRKRSLEQRLLVGPEFADEGLVFHHPDGSCLRPDAVSATFVRRVNRAGLPALTLKGLRHTWATLALERGVHPRVVQERLGHSTIAITLGIYSHVAPTLHDEAAELIGGLLFDDSSLADETTGSPRRAADTSGRRKSLKPQR
jgi:hypothetical protein